MMNDDDAARDSAEEKGLDRILALSDGVFAFAITLLVLGLSVPTLAQGVSRTSANLFMALEGDATAFEAYAVSFFVISIWWIAHHRLFGYIKRYDAGLMWRNILFLLFITIIPFLTELLSTYGDVKLAVVIYDGSQLLGGVALILLRRYALKNHLFSTRLVTPDLIKQMTTRGYIPVIVFAASIVVVLVLPPGISPSYTQLVLFALFAGRIPGRKRAKK